MNEFWTSHFVNRRLIIGVALIIVACLGPWFEAIAYDDAECLICHKDYGRIPEKAPKEVSRLLINEDLWKKDVHYEIMGLVCDDCHTDATPGTHAEGGLQKVNCAECHGEEADGYYKTVHWSTEVKEGRKKSDCADCHIPHAILGRSEDEAAFVKAIQDQCLSCHEERNPSAVGNLLLFRISAHRKSDASRRFDPNNCINCHFAQVIGHGGISLWFFPLQY